jgi:hypothetical protein
MRPFGVFLSCLDHFGDARRVPVSLPAAGFTAIAHSGDSQRVSFKPTDFRARHKETGPIVTRRPGRLERRTEVVRTRTGLLTRPAAHVYGHPACAGVQRHVS